MAIRNIRTEEDEVLRKRCREITEMTPKLATLIDDMLETMYEANGVGLAAPQVGILKRVVVIDVGDGPYILINPVILETDGSQTGGEGCLSLPGKTATVTRPNYVKVREKLLDTRQTLCDIIAGNAAAVEGSHRELCTRLTN